MSGKERRGKRMDRNKTLSTRIPTLGYYLIVTDTQETEKNYFEGLRNIIPENLKDRLVIKVEKARTVDLVARCKDLVSKDPQYRIPWIVLDRDQVEGFDSIIENAERNDISVGWSNPCIEIWFFAYFGIMPSYIDSVTCCEKFKDKYEAVTGGKYEKSNNEIYNKLNQYGNENKALEVAERKHNTHLNNGRVKPSEMCPNTTIYKLVGEIKSKINQKNIDSI